MRCWHHVIAFTPERMVWRDISSNRMWVTDKWGANSKPMKSQEARDRIGYGQLTMYTSPQMTKAFYQRAREIQNAAVQ